MDQTQPADPITTNTSTAQPPYQLLECIGRGSFGRVYQAMHSATGQLTAVKVLDLDASDDDLDEIRREIHLLSACGDSEYLTRYLGSYLVDMRLWIVMDYAGGGSVRRLMRAGGTIPERLIGPITRYAIAMRFGYRNIGYLICRDIPSVRSDVSLALAYLHKAGIIHRDIKGTRY